MFYKIDSNRFTFREHWWSTRSPAVLAGWLVKLLRIPIPCSGEDPCVDSLQPFEVGLEALPEHFQPLVLGQRKLAGHSAGTGSRTPATSDRRIGALWFSVADLLRNRRQLPPDEDLPRGVLREVGSGLRLHSLPHLEPPASAETHRVFAVCVGVHRRHISHLYRDLGGL